MLTKLIITIATLLSLFLFLYPIRLAISRIVKRNQFKESRGWFIYRLSRAFLLVLGTLAIISIWGVDVKNLWVFVTSIVGIIAIGFFAVWSMLSNIVAGFFLFVADPFRMDDEIVILPEDIRGTVIDLKWMFVVLEDNHGDILHIPNNLFFQRIVRKVNRKSDN